MFYDWSNDLKSLWYQKNMRTSPFPPLLTDRVLTYRESRKLRNDKVIDIVTSVSRPVFTLLISISAHVLQARSPH